MARDHLLRFVRFRGPDGMLILQRPDEVSTIMAGTRKGALVVYLLLHNNNRVEVTGETLDTALRKLEAGCEQTAVVTGEWPDLPQPQPAKEAANA